MLSQKVFQALQDDHAVENSQKVDRKLFMKICQVQFYQAMGVLAVIA